MRANRRSSRGRESEYGDLDWNSDLDPGSEWDRYLDWVPDDDQYVPKFRVPIIPLVVLGLLIGLLVAVNMSSHTTFMQDAFGGRGHHHHHARPTAGPTAGPPASATPSAPAGAAAGNCTIRVPPNPLSARGLATPYQLGGGCSEANADLEAFVQATIIDPATGALSVYQPLVVTAGTEPAVAPIVPTLPAGAVVNIMFGFNGNTLTQVGAGNSLRQGSCVGGLPGSPFGQVSYCNGPEFFAVANAAIASGKLKIPAAGTGKDGLACPTTRSFSLIDQDQSDNVTSLYLLTANGQTAQKNTANVASLHGASTISNGSDNALLDFFLDPALGCTPFTAPDLSNPGQVATSQSLDELAAAADQGPPAALTPVNDPMTVDNNGGFSIQKTNLFRVGVDQPLLRRAANTTANAEAYCTDMVNIQAATLELDKPFIAGAPSPDDGTGNNLFTFMAARLDGSFGNLNCQKFGLTDPVRLTLDANGVATDAALNVAPQTPTGFPARSTTPAATPVASASASATPTASQSPSPTPSASASPSPSPSSS